MSRDGEINDIRTARERIEWMKDIFSPDIFDKRFFIYLLPHCYVILNQRYTANYGEYFYFQYDWYRGFNLPPLFEQMIEDDMDISSYYPSKNVSVRYHVFDNLVEYSPYYTSIKELLGVTPDIDIDPTTLDKIRHKISEEEKKLKIRIERYNMPLKKELDQIIKVSDLNGMVAEYLL